MRTKRFLENSITPSLPAFLSPAVLDILVKEYDIHPISDPETDLRNMLS